MKGRRETIEDLKNFKESVGGVAFEISVGNLKSSFFNRNQIAADPPEDEEDAEDADEELRVIHYWGIYGIDKASFVDSNSPAVRFNKYTDLELTPEEKNGYLTDRIVAVCSSYLDKNPITRKYVLCKCDLKHKFLKDIEILYFHHHFQHLNLSNNLLTDVRALDGLPYLIYLNLSHNRLTAALDFKPPYFLTYVNLSWNNIAEMRDLSEFWALKKLDLSHNRIGRICGLSALRYLEVLNLANNKIRRIENLDYLNVISLNLQRNHVSSYDCGPTAGFKTMPFLTYVRLGHNEMNSLRVFEGSKSVQCISFESNAIGCLMEITHLQTLKLLIYLNLSFNPVTKAHNYKMSVLGLLNGLNFLDGQPVEPQMRVEAKNVFDPSPQVKAAKQYATLTVLSHMQEHPHIILAAVPSDRPPPPLLVIVAPPACGVEHVLHGLSDRNLSVPTVYTTNASRASVSIGKFNYRHVNFTQFHMMAQRGEFVTVYEIMDEQYGLTYEEFEAAADEGNIVALFTNLEGALTLRLRGYRPWIVLAIPESADMYRELIKEEYKAEPLNSIYRDAALKVYSNFISEDSYMTEAVSNTSLVGTINDEELTARSQYTSDERVEEAPEISSNTYIESPNGAGIKYSLKGGDSKQIWFPYYDIVMSDAKLLGPSHSVSRRSVRFQSDSEMTKATDDECECPPPLKEEIVDKLFAIKNTYLNFHLENAGYFYATVYTDDPEKALTTIQLLIKRLLELKHISKPQYVINKDKIYEAIVGERLKAFDKMLESSINHSVPGYGDSEPKKPKNIFRKVFLN